MCLFSTHPMQALYVSLYAFPIDHQTDTKSRPALFAAWKVLLKKDKKQWLDKDDVMDV